MVVKYSGQQLSYLVWNPALLFSAVKITTSSSSLLSLSTVHCTTKKKKQSFYFGGGRTYKEKLVSVVFFKSKSVFPGEKGEWVSRSAHDSPHLRIETRWKPHIAGKRRLDIHSSQSQSESVFTLAQDLSFNSSLQQNRSTCLLLYSTFIPLVRVGYEMVGWFSNRMGTSVDDGKTRGKD